MEVTIPYTPRPQQLEAHERAASHRFYVEVCHRRWGKTVKAINHLIRQTLTNVPHENPRGVYLAPQYKQAKAVAWDYLKYYSRPIPGIKINESELRIDYPNSARIKLAGADNWLALKGQYFDYAVCDEYAQWQPGAWSEAVRPALADRKGGALFIGTPRGHNEFYDLWVQAGELAGWGRELHRASESGILDNEELAALRREMTEEEYEQELECSWEAAIRGAFYGKQMAEAEKAGRIKPIAWEPELPVHTSWDLGTSKINETLVICFWQKVHSEVRLIRTWAQDLTSFPDIIKQLNQLPYTYGKHFVPHDINIGELGTGKTRLETARSLGLRLTPSKKVSLSDGINAVRQMLPRTWIDTENTRDMIEALKQYRTEYDDKNRVFKTTPLHDWTSHYCDAVRYFAINLNQARNEAEAPPMDYSALDKAI